METSVGRTTGQVSYTQSNPLFGMSLSSSDLCSIQPDYLKPARPRRKWCFHVIVVYLILQTPLNAFLIYKVFTLESSLSNPKSEKLMFNHISLGDDTLQTLLNNSQETKTLRGHLWSLQSQVKNLCGEEGQLVRLRDDLSQLNISNHNLEGKLMTISLKPGVCMFVYLSFKGPPGDQGPGQKGEKGEPGTAGSSYQLSCQDVLFICCLVMNANMQLNPHYLHLCTITVSVRLVPGKYRGRVEVKHNDVWGTICDDNFDKLDGKVICKMLGFQSVISTFTATPGSGPIWLDELRCTGAESDIFDCQHSETGVHNCGHDEDAGVQCV
uniref:SRCR domain-containing protein n=1 Tax=Acanthochromis polyacanthus TaxID=80966 RepID=A0A3Q1FRY1_9TELE